MYKCKTAILLIAFNRPDYLEQTFEQVRKVTPATLYFAVDGPRASHPDDIDTINQVRDFKNKIDWECDVHTLFRDNNVGCGYGPAGAIYWAFQTEKQLIILEDDCVADVSFFQFCDEMLERYKDDTRVWDISGRSHQQGSKFFDAQDYIFSRYAHTWGWATWKRCWDEFNIEVPDYPDFLSIGGAQNILATDEQAKHFNRLFEQIFGKIKYEITHSWDLQWVYTRFKMNGLGIVPKVNLIHNIGIIGTHSSASSALLNLESHSLLFPLRHPQFVMPIKDYEILHFNNHIKKLSPTTLAKIKSTVSHRFPFIRIVYRYIFK